MTTVEMRSIVLALIPARQKRWLRRIRLRGIRAFRSYGADELLTGLRSLGIRTGDTVLLHSGFSPMSGFQGTPGDVTNVFLEAIGDRGNLMMVSLPYVGSSLAYLRDLDVFDVRKTPSRMGLISEFFRRREDVLRSLHPTHPVLARGPDAPWLVEGHEDCVYGCGPGSPFEKALQLDARVVFFDALFNTFTFLHWLEHRVKDAVGLPLYFEPPFEVRVVDVHGQERTVAASAYTQEAVSRRRVGVLEAELRKRGLLARMRIGNTVLRMVRLNDVVTCVDDMTERGQYFYDLS